MNSDKRISLLDIKEKKAPAGSGLMMLPLLILLQSGTLLAFVFGCILTDRGATGFSIFLLVAGAVFGFLIIPFMWAGLKIVKPNEAVVLVLFGKFHGVLKEAGYYYTNPFAVATGRRRQNPNLTVSVSQEGSSSAQLMPVERTVSLKTRTLNNDIQKINDLLGNPVHIGIVVIWRVIDITRAVFNVDDYIDFLSIQADSALRDTIRMYPYDSNENDNEQSLRSSSKEIALRIQTLLQEKVEVAGLEITEARITHLSYAPEIAAAMLQRQQASAIVDARQLIVEGAVGMVEMALEKLANNHVVELDEERKAAMVSNLLVVLCAGRDAQPVVNSGSIY